MKFSTATTLALAAVSSVSAFTPSSSSSRSFASSAVRSTIGSSEQQTPQPPQKDTRPIYDPFGLYPEDSLERVDGRLQPLEPAVASDKTVKDPLNLYSDSSAVDDKPMSASVPFLRRPAMLDGTLPGDRGFDPFNFSSDPNALQWYRNAEIKHARLAMLAAVGWPLSELFDKSIASMFDLKPLLVFQDRVPSILNGGLDRTPPAYWAAALGIAFAIESIGIMKEQKAMEAGKFATPGDLGFDPLGLAGKSLEQRKYMAEAEIFNGRLAMMAITSFALQEWWFENSIVNQFPIFFKPINIALEQLQDQAGGAF